MYITVWALCCDIFRPTNDEIFSHYGISIMTYINVLLDSGKENKTDSNLILLKACRSESVEKRSFVLELFIFF